MKNQKRKTTKLMKWIIAMGLTLTFNFAVFAQETVKFNTITDAITCMEVNREAVKHLIIEGKIDGEDFSPEKGGEWLLFLTLEETFPNIEEVTILTDQDIPDVYKHMDVIAGWDVLIYERGLFSYLPNMSGHEDIPFDYWRESAEWIKRFSAPNVKRVGSNALWLCDSLIEVSFPSAVEIGREACQLRNFGPGLTSIHLPEAVIIEWGAFIGNNNLSYGYFPKVTTLLGGLGGNFTSIYIPNVTTLGNAALGGNRFTSIDIPKVTRMSWNALRGNIYLTSIYLPIVDSIGAEAFASCVSLTSVTLGTELKEPSKTYGRSMFNYVPTYNADLILGENVVSPKPDLTNRIWNYGIYFPNERQDYYWKSITIKYIGIEEVVKNATVDISPNPATDYFTLDFELKKNCNMEIILCDILGKEILTIHNGFAEAGLFSKTVDIEHLNSGVYYIKILIDGKYATVEKIVIN